MKTLSIEFVLTPDQKKELVEILRAKRSGVAQPCLPSTNCSAEAGAEAHSDSLINSVVPPKEAIRRPHCVIWLCGNAELHWINKGDSIQTENGHFTACLDHWICPRCGGGYGTTPPPALALQGVRAIRRNDALCRPADSEAGAQKGQPK